MGHEIFFKILDGPQKIILCCSFLIYYYSFLKVIEVWAQNVQITHQGHFFKKNRVRQHAKYARAYDKW